MNHTPFLLDIAEKEFFLCCILWMLYYSSEL